MFTDDWLTAVLHRVPGEDLESLSGIIAAAVAEASKIEPERVKQAFLQALEGEGFSVGNGVAIPHIELPDVDRTVVCLATVSPAPELPTIDGVAPDIFVFILAKPDPHAHLLLLAQLARLFRSRTLLDGLRRAESSEAMLELVRAAELRHARPTATRRDAAPAPSHGLVVVSLSGEKLVDALLVDLVEQGFADGCVLDAQSLSEATAREIPLFSGFREVFGDPGGRRMIVLEAPLDKVDGVLGALRRLIEEHAASDARVSVVPVTKHWQAPKPGSHSTAGH